MADDGSRRVDDVHPALFWMLMFLVAGGAAYLTSQSLPVSLILGIFFASVALLGRRRGLRKRLESFPE